MRLLSAGAALYHRVQGAHLPGAERLQRHHNSRAAGAAAYLSCRVCLAVECWSLLVGTRLWHPALSCCSPVLVRPPKACTSAHAHSICHLQVFSSLVALRRLTVNNCPRVGDNGMQVLRHLPQLTHLNLCGCIKVGRPSILGKRLSHAAVPWLVLLPQTLLSVALAEAAQGASQPWTPVHALQHLPATLWRPCLLNCPARTSLAVAAISLTHKLSQRQMTGMCPCAKDWPG